jgi:hypothetical protein
VNTMDEKEQGLQEVIADLTRIKEALSRSNSIFRFIDAGGALRGILLISGLLIAAFSAAFYGLSARYGAYAAAPVQFKALLWVLVGLSLPLIGYLKARNFLQGARKISAGMTLFRLLREVYTPQFIALVLPYFAAMVLIAVFLSARGLGIYITPALSLMIGLLIISLSGVFYMREIYIFGGVWLVATGLLALFLAELLHPLAVPGLTFSAGFILTSIYLYLNHPGGKGQP